MEQTGLSRSKSRLQRISQLFVLNFHLTQHAPTLDSSMASNRYDLLDDAEENELHHKRLLPLETRPFLRLTKRLLAPGSLTNPDIFKLPTPPPDGATDTQVEESQDASTLSAEVNALREDVLFDFQAFDVVIDRLQFLATQNAAERERYANDRGQILDTMESVRQSNATLRSQLDEARATLAQRKKFDELADKITGNRMLRTREEQHVNIQKLTEECEELQRESETYGGTWRERKEQFDKLVDEGVNLRKMIRDEQEEVERREGMDEGDAGEEDSHAVDTPANRSQSGNATPAPRSEGATTPMRPGSSNGRTPAPDESGQPAGDSLKPTQDATSSFSRGGSQAPSLRVESPRGSTSRAGSPAAGTPAAEGQTGKGEPENGEDIEMGDSTQAVDTPMAEGSAEDSRDTPQITVDAPVGGQDKMDTT
ncbi:putative Tho complex subunit 7 [Seiridium cardinale]|uniref:Tho complex subunit 7 n=1 Tax=Seiridium cardinale TaxID=138064 RepID=A0ABR2XDJ8_9PEZI